MRTGPHRHSKEDNGPPGCQHLGRRMMPAQPRRRHSLPPKRVQRPELLRDMLFAPRTGDDTRQMNYPQAAQATGRGDRMDELISSPLSLGMT